MDAAVKNLFAAYEKAFSALEVEKQVDLFADAFISAGPQGAIAQSREEFRKLAGKAGEFYRSVGQTGARILRMDETPISDHYSAVRVHWSVTFRKTGDKPVEFDVTYILQKTDPKNPKIVMFVSHQDEAEAMKKLGVLNGPS